MDELIFIEEQWKRITKERNMLEAHMSQQLPFLRESLLLQICSGRMKELNEDDLRLRLEQYGWSLAGRRFAIVVFHLSDLSVLNDRYTADDEPLVTFAAANIINELGKIHWSEVQVLNFQDLSIGLIFGVDDKVELQEFRGDMFRHLTHIANTIHVLLKIGLSVGMIKITSRISDLASTIGDVRLSIPGWTEPEKVKIIDMEGHSQPYGGNVIYYPYELEKDMLYWLRLGDDKQAYSRLKDFLSRLANQQCEKNSSPQFTYLLHRILSTMELVGFKSEELFSGANLFKETHKLRTHQEQFDWLKNRVLLSYFQTMLMTNNKAMKETVDQVIEAIRSQYSQDLSLEAFAYQFGLTDWQLSTAFKRITGITFIDYLTDIRLRKAKELLGQTDMKIQEVAEQVGYQPAYFNKIFKKITGVTPGQYRASSLLS